VIEQSLLSIVVAPCMVPIDTCNRQTDIDIHIEWMEV